MDGVAVQYRKKPVVIDAMQWDGSQESFAAIREWAAKVNTILLSDDEGYLVVATLEDGTGNAPQSVHTADKGDWIIRGVKGEFYPCKPDIFALTYEPVAVPTAPEVASPALKTPELGVLLTEMESALEWVAQTRSSRVPGAPIKEAIARYLAARTAIEAEFSRLYAVADAMMRSRAEWREKWREAENECRELTSAVSRLEGERDAARFAREVNYDAGVAVDGDRAALEGRLDALTEPAELFAWLTEQEADVSVADDECGTVTVQSNADYRARGSGATLAGGICYVWLKLLRDDDPLKAAALSPLPPHNEP